MNEREQAARNICATLHHAGHRALFAGGCVRDRILGQIPKDYDIATSASASEVIDLFPKTITVGAEFGVVIVIQPEGHFEVATFRRDGPYLDGRHPSWVRFEDERNDAQRRDFTINAMFFDPATDTLLDYVGGQEDLRNHILRTVGEPRERFEEDHLRLLRAIRFAARLNYTLHPDTRAAIIDMAPRITHTSDERIRDELTKTLTEGGARTAFQLLDETGLLMHILPEVAAMKKVEQPPDFHPEGDVFEHTLLMLDRLENPSPVFAWAVLLHDVGKPPTQTFEDRIRFNYHDKVGARMAAKICQRLRMSNHQTERIVWLIEQHMRLAFIPEMRESKRKRFVREEGFDDLVRLCHIDCLVSGRDPWEIKWINDYKNQLEPEAVRPEPLLTGHDLIQMGYLPGPLFAEILHALEDAQLEGALTSPDSAREFIQSRWPLS